MKNSDIPNLRPKHLVSRDYFAKDSDSLELPVLKDGLSLTITVDDLGREDLVIPATVEKTLESISQLGLKELWLGGEPAQHDRWTHSTGTFTVGSIWLAALAQDNRIPADCLSFPLDSWSKIKSTVGTCFLLHDYGHLPFAHLADEVLQSINWLPGKSGSLESSILDVRLKEDHLDATWDWLVNSKLNIGAKRPLDKSQARQLVQSLIEGTYGLPWLQVLVNSPLDADKIDYLRYDSLFLRKTDYPVGSRLAQERSTQWLTEFLQDQHVNHSGLLCLNGRSSQAAADLWRERMFAYDRIYLAPELRVPDRMAFEIIQQFVIRCTMSEEFLKSAGLFDLQGYADRFTSRFSGSACSADELIALKFDTVRELMSTLLNQIKDTKLEFTLLKRMVDLLGSWKGIDSRSREFLCLCFNNLEALSNNPKGLRMLVKQSLVREPFCW